MGKTLTRTIKIDQDALAIIDRMTWDQSGNQVLGKLPPGQLDRKLYENVNKGLALLDGKWNRKYGAHVFDNDPRSQITEMLGTGVVVVERDGFFRTPNHVTFQMLTMLGNPDPLVLEPSAGDGAICDVLAARGYTVHAIERNPQRRETLRQKGYEVLDCTDFMEFTTPYFTIVMNPPFEQLQDVDHVNRAYDLLCSGGELVSVMAESAFFRSEQKCVDFRKLVDCFGRSVELPKDSFKESGTSVSTRLVYLAK